MQDQQNQAVSAQSADRVPVAFIALVVLLCPFAFLPFTYHATYVKYTIFQTAFLALVLCLVGGLIGLFPFRAFRAKRWDRNVILAAACAGLFFFVNVLSISWSDFPKASLLRVLELSFYIGWFLLAAVFLTRRERVARIGWLYVIAAVITSAGAFAAYALRNRLDFISPFQGRIGFPAGNPIFLAGYLLPPLFICGFASARWLFPKTFGADARSRSLWKSVALALVAAFLLYAIYWTRSQSAYIGLAFACVALLLFVRARFGRPLALELLAALVFYAVCAGVVFYHFSGNWMRLSLAACLLFLVLVAVFLPRIRKLFPYFSFLFSAVVAAVFFFAVVTPELPRILETLVARGSTREGGSTLAVRWVLFGGGLRMIAERPLLGWAAGTFPCNYPLFAAPEQFIVNPFGTSAMNLHNEPLQILVEVGLVGLVAVALMLWFVFRSSWKTLVAERIDAPALVGWGIFIGTLGMLFQELGSVGMRFWDFAPFVWTNFALLVALAPAPRPRPRTSPIRRPRAIWARLLLLVAVALLLAKYWHVVAWGDLMSQKHRKDAQMLKQASWDVGDAEVQQRFLTELLPDHALPGPGQAAAFLTTVLAGGRQSFLKAMRDESDLALTKSLSMENMLHAYYDKAVGFRLDRKFAEAAAVLEELQRQAPNIAGTRFVLGDYYELAGNLPKAVVNYAVYRHQIPYDRDPESAEARKALEALIPRLNPEQASAARVELSQILPTFRRDSAYSHIVVAALYEREARNKSAAAELEVAFNMGVKEPLIFTKLATLWHEAGEPQRARFWLNQGRKMFPADGSFDETEQALNQGE